MRIFALISPVITSVLLSACATRDFLPVYDRESYSMQGKKAGLVMAVEPLMQKDLIDKYFGIDLINEGVFPIYVKVANNTQKSIYYIDEQAIKLDLSSRARSDDRNIIDNTAPMSAGAATATFLFTPIGLLPVVLMAGGKALADASVINYTFNQNKLHANSIAPGESIGGFIYFKLPDKELPKQWRLYVTVAGLSEARTEEFYFEYVQGGGLK